MVPRENALRFRARLLLDYLLEYCHIMFGMLVDKPDDLLVGEFFKPRVHFEILYPDHLDTLRLLDIEPDNLHVLKRKHRVMPRRKRVALVFVQPPL